MSENINKVPSSSPNFNTEAAEKIKELFHEVVADGKIDFETLKTLLAPDLEDERENASVYFGLVKHKQYAPLSNQQQLR